MANKDKKNIDKAEVEKFNALAHKWWDPTSEFRPLHEINPLRVSFIKSKVDLKGKKLLDVGCGGGILSESMAREGAHVTAIDQGEKVIKIAQLHNLESKLDINYKDFITQDPRFMRAEELKYLKGDSSKIRKVLGWKPEYRFETLMDEMIEHWMEIYGK